MRILALFSLLMISPLMGMFRGTPTKNFFFSIQRTAPHLLTYSKQQKQRPLRLEANAIKHTAEQAKVNAAKWKARDKSKSKN